MLLSQKAMQSHPLSENLFYEKKNIYTKSKYPGFKVYAEKIKMEDGEEYRLWDPYKSKLSSALHKGLKHFPFTSDSHVLYLGAASGTTASHISDIVSTVFCIEFSERSMTDLLFVCEKRKNMVPILADASKPESFAHLVKTCNIIYQDIAQPNQTEILEKNFVFLREGGYFFFCIKSRSIDVTAEPQKIFEREISRLKKSHEVLQVVALEPYELDHVLVCGRK